MAVEAQKWKRRKETAVVSFFLWSFLIVPIISLILTGYLLFYTSLWWLMLVYLAWMWWDWDLPDKGGRTMEWWRGWSGWTHMADYFPMKVIKTAELDPKNNYLLVWHPHGIISMSAVVSMCTAGTGFSKLYPGIDRCMATLNIHFQQPFRRDVIAAFGAIGVTYRALKSKLGKKEGGNAVALVVGGAEEALESHEDNFTLCLDKRKGFIKVALQTGAQLVPVYSFGETSLYYQAENPQGSRLRNFQTWVKNLVGLSPVVIKGMGLTDGSFGVLPYRRPVNTVVGAPIPVQKTEHPTKEQIEDLHNTYKTALIDLFEAHKEKYDIPKDTHLNFY